ncbi:hypothetical protein P4S93_06430 [Aneurinibacillus thermoaerophilus]|uniref:hypothetical protein n=1 Tax=Aneurinibacillus thermoaerophilus TaxID=143495 RepID=UPI002E24409F|nr:hypothetical protein [Aneurinibacillus thermoaerophilus]MED0760414.1 hypothetical protein [Aneurinibacillus thermoaerophilus]
MAFAISVVVLYHFLALDNHTIRKLVLIPENIQLTFHPFHVSSRRLLIGSTSD